MEYQEYFRIFDSIGDYKVEVRFKNFDGNVANTAMRAADIVNLIDPETGLFVRKMYFDDYLFDISKYEIDPIRMKIIIKAKQSEIK